MKTDATGTNASTETRNDLVYLPEPGPGKRDPKELDRQLDRALEDSMEASDPPATIMPEVHERDDAGDCERERRERQRSA